MKIVLIIGLMLFSGVLFAAGFQSPIQEKKADFYASEAVKYFKLKDSKKEAIYQAKLGLIQAQKVMYDKKKSGELEESDMEAYRKENLLPFNNTLMNEMGVKWKELDAFNKKVHPEMNKLKM